MTVEPRILVGTLYIGENEFEQCRESLAAQTYKNWEHKVHSHLPNRQAHQTLYADFMASRQFDLFIKLDADMVFSHDGALRDVVGFFSARPDLDHATFALRDFMTDSFIMGLHVFSNRARWQTNGEELFVDPDPVVPGQRLVVWQAPAPFALHSPNPSPLQAFKFGAHRSLKAYQPGRESLVWRQAIRQWRYLTKVWDHFERKRDRRLGLAILGAELVRTGELRPSTNQYTEHQVEAMFEMYSETTVEELFSRLSPVWSPRNGRLRRWALSMGPRVFLSASFEGIDRLRSHKLRPLQ